MELVKWDELPKEIQGRMLEEQESQCNERNPDVFKTSMYSCKYDGGFNWFNSTQGQGFWQEVLEGNFDVFYEKYPPLKEFTVNHNGKVYKVEFLVGNSFTVCAIGELTEGELTWYDSAGVAKCSDNDVFCYKVGRKIAFDRTRLKLDKDLRAAVTQEFNRLEGYPYQGVPSELSDILDEFFGYMDDIIKRRDESKERHKKFFTEIKEVCEKHGMDITDFTFKGEQIKDKGGNYEIEISY